MRLALCALLLIAAPASAQQASPAEKLVADVLASQEPSGWDKPDPWLSFPAKPAQDALGTDLYAEYRQALKRNDCKTPARLVQYAYLKQYPELQPAFANRDVVGSWRANVFIDAYPYATLCTALAGLKAETERLKAEGHPISPARSVLLGSSEDRALAPRNLHIWNIERIASRDFIPAIKAYLRLEQSENTLIIEPEHRLYYLLRLKRLGASLDRHDERIEAARRVMLPSQIAVAECMAEEGNIVSNFGVYDECAARQ